ncbi:transcription initiation factor tfiid [Holotrichia oblita]|uniref:Transcription initiation factor tfiid n=2 Tax=Holotrichia oblita TaxID=644536 RepID=A0ACB9TCU1_HOLOL|nr:transcription initiation factor tfiid [Holotrichia oblita]
MGEYHLKTMEELKKDNTNKIKRNKHDQVTQAVLTYLQKRNYPITTPAEMKSDEMQLEMAVDNEVSRPNSIMYSCYNSDPTLIDHSYLKFISWVKDINHNKEHEDLSQIIAPLFCHLYLELIQRGHTEKAANFLKAHLSIVEKYKHDNNILKLINIITNDMPDIQGIKKKFRSNKYIVVLDVKSADMLKKFLGDSCHTIMLQVFQTCFQIQEGDEPEAKTNDSEHQEMINGHDNPSALMLKLQQAVSSLKSESSNLIFTVGLSNIKDDVTCGLINREAGIAIYSYNSSIFLKSLITLKQLDGTDELSDVVLRKHKDRIYDLSYVSNLNYLVSASQDKTIRLFDLSEYSQKMVYRGHDNPVYCISTSKGGDYIISGSYDHTARLWSMEYGNTLRVYVGHTQEITSIDFHLNDLYLCTGSADKNIRMWSIKDANPVRLFLGSKGIIYCVAFSSNGKYLASAGDDKRLRIWDLITGKQLSEIKVGIEPIIKLTWSSDDNVLCTGTLDGIIRTWDTDNLIKTSVEPNQYTPKYTTALNAKLLSIEYCHGTFACLTAKPSNSSYLSI